MYSGFSFNALRKWEPLCAIALCAYNGTHGLASVVFERHIPHALHINSCLAFVSLETWVFVPKSAATTKHEKSQSVAIYCLDLC